MLKSRLKEKPEVLLGALALLFAGIAIGVSLLTAMGGAHRGEESSASLRTSVVININTVSAQELTELDGISTGLAQNIVEYRQEHGDFESVDELLQVSGIGEKKLAKIRNYIKAE